MKTVKTIFLTLLFLGCLFFVGLHTFVSLKGKDILVTKLHNVFQSDVSIGRVTTSFPLTLIVKDLEIKNWFRIKKVVAGAGMIDVLSGNFVLSDLRLEKIDFDLEKRKHGEENKLPVNLNAVSGTGSGEDLPLPQHIVLKRLIVSDGTFAYTDYTKGDNPITLKITELNLRVDNFQWPFSSSVITSFKGSGKVPWVNNKEEGSIDFEGWINLYKKDMRADLQIKDIDGVYIYPYYSSWVDIDKARVDKAKLNFTCNITSLNNEVTAPCHLELAQISFKPRNEKEKEARMEKITNMVLGLMKAMDQGKIVLNFNLKTKLDSPEFGLGVIREALKDKIYEARKSHDSGPMQIIKFPGKILEGTFNSAADLTKSVINGTVNVGKELRNAVDASFDRSAYVNNTLETQPSQPLPKVSPTAGEINSTNSTQP